MATTRTRKVNLKVYGIWTAIIYLFLIGAIGTYFLPIVRVQVPVLGQVSWSVRDIVKTIPKGVRSEEPRSKKLSAGFDFIDFVKEVVPKSAGADGKTTPRQVAGIIMAALTPIALLLAYLALLIGLFIAPLKKSGVFVFLSALATACTSYVYLSIYYFDGAAQKAFAQALSNVKDSPFFFVAQHLVQKVSIRPDTGLIVLLLLSAVIFLAVLVRMSRATRA